MAAVAVSTTPKWSSLTKSASMTFYDAVDFHDLPLPFR
eukprot:CAMPEP_0118666122 /NCGR_PEP_ID=MMETSP0785-20121206/19026_1 /TAXON_ID=91992 /ORGANISM="Bolidomonas pacifica, Strain CCMP 1866" /LENGTH=37 /DNA_ID= /DNA_START= /DNA_END= /DNA_ORIENTATION=